MKFRSRKQIRAQRHRRIRRKISGTAERPRMCITVSDKNLYVQLIDDVKAHTLISASTLGTDHDKSVETAGALGKECAREALDKGISRVVVDRAGFKYHGRVKALVEAAREAGLSISAKEEKCETAG